MDPQFWISAAFPLGISFLSFAVSFVAWRTSRTANRTSRAQLALDLHAGLYRDKEDYEVVYWTEEKYYFDQGSRGAPGNFLGSEHEQHVDSFLDRLNFVCMSLLNWPPGEEELLFKRDIRNIYQKTFFKQYFSFLAGITDEYYFFIHKYAHERLNLPRPKVAVPNEATRRDH